MWTDPGWFIHRRPKLITWTRTWLLFASGVVLQTVIYKGLYGIDRFFLKEIKNVMFLNKIDVPYCLVVFFVVCPRLRPFWSVFGELVLFSCPTAKQNSANTARKQESRPRSCNEFGPPVVYPPTGSLDLFFILCSRTFNFLYLSFSTLCYNSLSSTDPIVFSYYQISPSPKISPPISTCTSSPPPHPLK